MTENRTDSVVFIAGGAGFGAGISATVGGMGLAGGFGAVGIGMAPVTAAGAIAGAAAYGAFKAIGEGDAVAFGAIGIGALGGAGVSATIGGMGLAGGFGAVSIGMGSMAAAGGVFGLGIYGMIKALNQDPGQRIMGAIDAFGRMESKVLEMEAYTQALLELDPTLAEAVWQQKFAALEIEEELKTLKVKIGAKTAEKNNFSSATYSTSTTNSVPQKSKFSEYESADKFLAIEAQPAQIWRCVHNLKGHSASVNSLAFSPDGQTLASGSDDSLIYLWNLSTGQRKPTFFLSLKSVLSVAFSSDGQKVISGDLDKTITRWKLSTKESVTFSGSSNSLYSHSGYVYSIAISPDGKTLASGSADKTIKLWNLHNEKLIRTLNGHSDTVFSVAISPDGQTLASGSADKTIRLWSLNSYQPTRILTGHSGWVMSVTISPDGQILASGSGDSIIKLWNLQTGELLHTLAENSQAILSVAISPDGQILASARQNGTINLWNLRTKKILQTLSGCNPVTFSPDGQTLVCAGKGGNIKIWRQMFGSDEFILDAVLTREWWEVLGMNKNAHPHEVKLAYRRLARQYHPDVNRSKSAIATMQAINKAYEEFLKEFSKACF